MALLKEILKGGVDVAASLSEKARGLIDEISDFANVDENGFVSVFHRTSKSNAEKIRKSGKFTPKEDGIFFSTKPDGQASGYGNEVVELKIPADKLELDDLFDGEAHLKLPAKANKPNDISPFIQAPVDVKDLMFLHGTSPEKLGLFSDIGGLPMPSMAVTQKDIPFSWGDIDLIGKPENFNPATNSLNDLYSADAYTVRGKEPFKIPNKDAWEKFSNEFEGFGENSAYLTHKLANSSSKVDANPEAYRMMDDFFNHRSGGGYKKFAEENGIKIPVGKDGRQRLVDLKYNILENYGENYSQWVSSKMDSYFKPENYYLNDKNKVKLYDADEMTRLMKKSRGQGTEGVTGGEGYERAMEASKFKSLSQAKQNKGLLFEKKIADQKYSEMNYQDLPPTSYFESKPARTVGIDEFGGAIVPANIDAKTLKILEDRGIPIERYTDEVSRLKARDKFQSQMFTRPEAAIGGLLALTAMGASEDADAGVVSSGVRIAKEILNLRAQGRANEVTNEMMSYADPQYLFDNTPLPMDTASRLNRAEGGGFDTNVPLYHSGNKEIESINPDFKASFGGEKGAFYTTTNSDVANTYGGDIIQQFYGKTPNDALIVDAHNRGFSELGKETVTSKGTLGDVVPQQFDKWSAGNRSIGRPEVIHTDMVSAGYPSDTTIFNRLKDEGFYNRIDPEDEFYDGTPSTVRADQNATNLRSTSARFDPEFSHLSNTLASNPVATTSAGLLAMDNVGQESQGLMDAIAGRDAMLTSQQVEYLNNQRELQQLLGTQDTNKFNYADIVPMKRNKETGERSFAMTGLLRDIIEAGHNVVQSQRTGIQNQQSLWDIIL